MFGCRAFSVAGPMAWNLLPDRVHDPTPLFNSFQHDFKTFLISVY